MDDYGFENKNNKQENENQHVEADNEINVNENADNGCYTIPYTFSNEERDSQVNFNPAGQFTSNSTAQQDPGTGTQGNTGSGRQINDGNTGMQMGTGFYEPVNQLYYKENYKKTQKSKANIFQLLLVAFMGAILGGAVVFTAIQFIAPVIQPGVNGLLNVSGIASNTPTNTTGDNGVYKKVEITKSDSAVTAISEKVSPSIVGIRVTALARDFFLGQQESSGEGSGIIIRNDGYILTNYHVIENALSNNSNTLMKGAKIEVILPSEKEKSYEATVIGKDIKSDLAVLKINAGNNLPAAELGDSDKLKQGELAVAIGNPGGLDYMGSVTAGVISGLNRTITTEDGKKLTLIQTDAAINPGNSGGALCNSQGQVIGINTIKISATGFEGLGFAIPINHAKEVANNLIEFKYVKGRPYIGIGIRREIDAESARQFGVPEGILVGTVTPFSAAERAGIMVNDIITKFDGQAVNTYAKLEELKNKHKPGDKVNVEVSRYEDEYKTTKTLNLTLDEDKN